MADQDNAPVAIVTGASSGIGLAAAKLLAETGYRLALAARTESKLETAAGQIDGEPLVHPCDVADPEQADGLIRAAHERFGRIDAVVNNAGTALLKSIAETTAEQWRENVDVNLTSVFATTRAAWPIFQQQESGLFVNVSSMASKDPFPGLGVYGAAKVGVNMLTLVASREGANAGITAVCIAPGAVETPLLRSMFNEKKLPGKYTLDPEEVAAAIRDCITGQRAFTSGETIFLSR